MKRSLTVGLISALLSLTSTGRTQTWTVTTGSIGSVTMQIPSQVKMSTAGFCGIRETETDQTLVDGTHIKHKSKVRFCRDSRSRTREEYFANDSRGEPSPAPTSIHIFDPVEGANYSLDVFNRIAHRTAIPQSPPTGRVYTNLLSPNPSYVLDVDRKVEQLDSQMMEGLLVEGTRTTVTTPTGMLGNDRPIVTVEERWFSPELQMEILVKRSDPRGDNIQRFTGVDRSEPDPALFRVPPDYTIVSPTLAEDEKSR